MEIISERTTIEISLTEFINYITAYNLANTIKFTPTTVIDFGDSLHTLIMTRTEIDECGNVFFYLKKNSVTFANKSQGINSELPFGNYRNVRFHIDPLHINEIGIRIRVNKH